MTKSNKMNCIVCGKLNITPSNDKVKYIAHAECYLRVGKERCDELYQERKRMPKFQNPLKEKK